MLLHAVLQPVECHRQYYAQVACKEAVHIVYAADSQPALQRQVLLPVTCLGLIFTFMVWSPGERERVSMDPLSFLQFIAQPPF